MRTKDWACYLCGYPLASPAFKFIDKTYGEISQERLNAKKPPAQMDEQVCEDFEQEREIIQEMQNVPLVNEVEINEKYTDNNYGTVTSEEQMFKQEIVEDIMVAEAPEDETTCKDENKPEAVNNEQEEIETTECNVESETEAEVQESSEAVEHTIIDEPSPVQSIEEEPKEECETSVETGDFNETIHYKIVNVPEIVPSAEEEPECEQETDEPIDDEDQDIPDTIDNTIAGVPESEPSAEYDSEAEPKPEPEQEPEPEVETAAPADIDITIDKLLTDYAEDYVSATNKYLNKILRLSGYAASIDVKEVLAINYIRMTDSSLTLMKSVQCMFDKKYANNLRSLEKGQQVTIQGKYTGSLIAMRMTDCILINC
jgi:hypothetical protein